MKPNIQFMEIADELGWTEESYNDLPNGKTEFKMSQIKKKHSWDELKEQVKFYVNDPVEFNDEEQTITL